MVEHNDSGFRKTHDFGKKAGEGVRGPFIPCATSNNPRPGQWDGRKMSKKHIADYKRFQIADGAGVRNSLYVSGCPFACSGWETDKNGNRVWAGCFNKSIWNFDMGIEYTAELEDKILYDLSYPQIKGITFLGGEPFLNTPVLVPLAKRIRDEYGNTKDIWSWTGYTWEELHRDGETPDKLELLAYVDILVDGRFDIAHKDAFAQFRGSNNQRIIDVRKSNMAHDVVLWDGLNDQKHTFKEMSVGDRAVSEGTES